MFHIADKNFSADTSFGTDSEFLLHANLGRGAENELMA